MPGFFRSGGALVCDGLELDAVAAAVGTPVHVYSAALIADRYRRLDAAFAAHPHAIYYALKANGTLAVVRHLRTLGARADANSAGELAVAARAGFAPREVVLTGVGKTDAELAQAVALGVHAVNVESPGEVDRLDAAARAAGARARFALRINPDVDARSHPHISTGLSTNKFGMSVADALAVADTLAARPALQLVGLHAHIGSQITDATPFAAAAAVLADLARALHARGVQVEHLDVGGGLGIVYEPGRPVLPPHEYAEAILPAVRSTGAQVLLEPGRWLVGPAGVLLTRVVDIKRQAGGRWFVIVDAGMTDLIRPALYGAWHAIEPVRPRAGAALACDVVGPVCETADALGLDRTLPPVLVGDLLAVRDTGAYGAVMASNYNRRPTAAEVMVDDGAWRVVRRRQTIDDLLQWET